MNQGRLRSPNAKRRATPWSMQRIALFQQNGSGEHKVSAVRERGRELCFSQVVSIDQPLPQIIDDPTPFLPEQIDADLVVSFVKHPDLASELASRCAQHDLPLLASGQRLESAITPPT